MQTVGRVRSGLGTELQSVGSRTRRIARDFRDPAKRNEDLWALSSSKQAEQELDKATLVDRTSRPFVPGDIIPADQTLEHFDRDESWVQRETAGYTTRPSFIDPLRAWVISRPAHLVHRAVTFNYRVLPKPDFMDFVLSRLRRKPTIDLPEAVTLRFPFLDENNYCHFLYHLVGGRLRLAEECGVSEDVPIVVGERLYRQPFFHDFLRLAGMEERRFVVQDQRYVRCGRVFLPQCFEHGRENLEYLHRCLSLPDSDPQATRRLFSSRMPSTGRNITNMADVEDLCRRFGFEIVEQEGMSLEETMELFSQARFVVGIFGAGLGSIAFRKNAPLSLLEIFPPAYTWPRIFYRFFASALGHRHYYYGASFGNPDLGITGNITPATVPHPKPNRDRSAFAVDTEKLEKVLRAMLDEAG